MPSPPTRSIDTSTWGRNLNIRCGLLDAALSAFAPFTPSPDSETYLPVVKVDMPANVPSLASRDVLVYVSAKQVYNNNPNIVSLAGGPITTPVANQLVANQGLYGRVRSGRGGTQNEEEFVIPAHGIALHVGADSVAVEVGFFPSRTGWGADAAFEGARATGWEVRGGIATSASFVDRIRQELPVSSATDLRFEIPEFARRLRVATMVPDLYGLDWQDWLGRSIAVGPLTSPLYWADAPAPIPIDARFVTLLRLACANGAGDVLPSHPVTLEWERQA